MASRFCGEGLFLEFGLLLPQHLYELGYQREGRRGNPTSNLSFDPFKGVDL